MVSTNMPDVLYLRNLKNRMEILYLYCLLSKRNVSRSLHPWNSNHIILFQVSKYSNINLGKSLTKKLTNNFKKNLTLSPLYLRLH